MNQYKYCYNDFYIAISYSSFINTITEIFIRGILGWIVLFRQSNAFMAHIRPIFHKLGNQCDQSLRLGRHKLIHQRICRFFRLYHNDLTHETGTPDSGAAISSP